MEIIFGVSVLFIIFFLVIILGLQIQITGINRRLDDLVEKLDKKAFKDPRSVKDI